VKLGGQSPDKLTPSSALALSLRKLSGTLLSGQELPAEQLRSVLEGLQKLDAQQSSQEAASAFQWLEPAPEPEPDLGPELPELVKPSASSDNGGGTEGGGAEGGHLTCGQLVHELFGFFLWVPALMFALNMALGCLLAAIEEWELVAGVQYVFSVQVGLASPLGQANTIGPTTNFGMAMTGVIAAWTMGFTGAISTLAATSHLVDALTLPGRWLAAHMQCIGSRDERKAHREAHKLGHVLSKRRRHRKHQRPLLIGKLLNALLLGPLLLLLPCVTLGAVLAALETADCSAPSALSVAAADLGAAVEEVASLENATTSLTSLCLADAVSVLSNRSAAEIVEPCSYVWPYTAGVFYTLADAAGLPNPLVNEAPVSYWGQIVACYISILTYELAAVAIGLGQELGEGLFKSSFKWYKQWWRKLGRGRRPASRHK